MARTFPIALIFALPALMGLVPAAMAQDASGPQTTTATYQDWTLRCDHLATTPPRIVCEVVQPVRAADGQAVVAQVVIGRPAPDQPLKLVTQLAAGVWLPANVTLTVPGGKSATAIYTRCQQLCVADTDLADDFVETLRSAGEPATLSFQDGARRSIELPVSLNGFTAATNQMNQLTAQ